MPQSQELPTLPSLPDDLPVSTWMDKMGDAVHRGVAAFFRQSTDDQRLRHTGSQKVQEQQLDQLEPFGVTRDQVQVILAYGESGREGVVRKRFQELKERIRGGKVGLLVLARHDRLSRNTADADEVFRLLIDHEVLLMVDGRIYDPSDAGDRLILGLYAQFAEYENRTRSRWMALTRLAKARALELRIRLPGVLVWADEMDPEYRKDNEAAGLADWLEGLPEKPCSVVDGRKYRILPYPDRNIATAVRLIRKWLLETRSEREVEKRIREGCEGYPKPGEVPAGRTGKPYPKARVAWAPLTGGWVREFVQSPALFGCYRYQARALRPKKRAAAVSEALPLRREPPERAEVEVKGAFRSWFTPDEQRIVQRILSGGSRRKAFAPNPELPPCTTHAIGMLRCSVEVSPGRRCRRRIKAYTNADRKEGFRYVAGGCRQTANPHFVQVPSVIDDHVLEILVEVFRPESLGEVAQALRVDRASSEGGLRELKRKLQGAKDRLVAARQLALQAQMDVNVAEERQRLEPGEESAQALTDERTALAEWKRGVGTAVQEVRSFETRIREQERRLEDYGAVTEAELERCIALASDLSALIERVRAIPGALQRIVECLTSEVWVRKLAVGIFELQVDFPSGESVVRVFRGFVPVTSHALRVLVSERWNAGVPPDVIAQEIGRYPHPLGRTAELIEAEGVHSIVLLHEHFETESPREGEHRTVAALASMVGERVERVMAYVLHGKLGPARWEDGQLAVCPTDAELHKAFPEYALREVARVHRLQPEELVSASDIFRANRNLPALNNLNVYVKDIYRDAARFRYLVRCQAEEAGLSTVPNEKEAVQVRSALAAAVAALGRPGLDVKDFHPLVAVVRRLGPVCPWVKQANLKRALDLGTLAGVCCLGLTDTGRLIDNLQFVHVPPKVLNATSADAVSKWLPRPEGDRHTRGARMRALHAARDEEHVEGAP